MTGAQLWVALGQIQRLFSEGSSTGFSDTQLLADFAARRDEAAFAALIARHGPMVLAVCRGILRDPHDAEDAFQATFLVLARKAGSAWAEGQLGGWLHKVAHRIAVRASADAARRRALERRAAEAAAMEYTPDGLEDDLRPALHEEVARLPAKLRLPVVLCYLEGLTHAQAAVALRCGEATLRRRLAGARERLRLRLARRGFAPSAAGLGGALANEAGAAVPPVCAEATVRAAIRVAAGEAAAAVVGTRVAHLTRGGLNLAITGRNMAVCALLAVGAAVSLAAGITAAGGKRDKPAADRINSPLTAKPTQSSAQRAAAVEKPIALAQPQTPAKTSRSYTTKGTVLAPDGKPAAGATVYWLGYTRFQQRRITRPKGMKDGPDDRPKTLATGMTGADGRYALTAAFDADTYPMRTMVVKAPGVGLSARNSFSETVKEAAGNGNGVTFQLRRPATIEGCLSGVHVEMIPIRKVRSEMVPARTDARGRYRAAGAAADKFWVTAYPDPGSGYIAIEEWREFSPAEAKVREFNLALPKGRVLRGQVVEAGSGQPVPGGSVMYEPARGNPHNHDDYRFDSPVWTDGDGHFALTAVPGAGLLAVEAPTRDFITVSSTGQSTVGSLISRPHGFARVDVPADKDKAPPETLITLRRGVTFETCVVGPDGAPLDMVMGWCVEPTPTRIEEGWFRIDGADPERTYRAFFLSSKRRLGAFADLKYDPKGPAVVQLQPTATAKGILVDPKGRPLEGVQILLWMVLTTEQRELTVEDFAAGDGSHAIINDLFTQEPLLQKYPAEFNCDKLIPGVRYYVLAHVDQNESYHPIPPLQPGEVRDLGKIVIKPQANP